MFRSQTRLDDGCCTLRFTQHSPSHVHILKSCPHSQFMSPLSLPSQDNDSGSVRHPPVHAGHVGVGRPHVPVQLNHSCGCTLSRCHTSASEHARHTHMHARVCTHTQTHTCTDTHTDSHTRARTHRHTYMRAQTHTAHMLTPVSVSRHMTSE